MDGITRVSALNMAGMALSLLVSLAAVIAVLRFLISLSASKIRMMSIPFLMLSSTNFSTTSSW